MLLKRIINSLPSDLINLLPVLDQAGIKTTENLLFTPHQILLSSIPSIRKDDLDALIAFALRRTALISVTADTLLPKEEITWTGFGVYNLDQLLDAWDGVGILEIAGPKKVGKSLLALHAVLRTLKDGGKAVWIDTDGSFSPIRAKIILESWDVDTTEVLNRLEIRPCFKVEPDLYDIISSLQIELMVNTLMSTTAQGHAEMIAVMEQLAEMTQTYGLTSIVINTTVSSSPINPLSNFSPTTIKPALGIAFGYCADVTLLIQETGKVFGLVDEEERDRVRRKPGLRGVVEVLKSRVSAGGRWSVFETDGIQLFDVVPPPLVDERSERMSRGTVPQRPVHGPLRETLIP
ncbi:hypothetical protein TREMEDRAFT_70770 [Tremella mesenterica DSM 1558]|uniref:uncharacterized protein n=1 Tax=Tremella mesenterica (strain ATCC 24925 / CBS 8224 / DSM 1558 / NBRC 9311 / NRRL Y-6157 / RJB 2259-6 / UBC 559-6) TaxID=578456 RepID=UPI0003F4A3C6|nr:uncharacterized protein TREMEDRAFT_70770 [Tremella mesenterica DSM 1558]EIW72631.1 hypothetical protein TREMEDRAFT_70770 [Tremella mesenterica DSM 1558]